jgi:hypothetical protein
MSSSLLDPPNGEVVPLAIQLSTVAAAEIDEAKIACDRRRTIMGQTQVKALYHQCSKAIAMQGGDAATPTTATIVPQSHEDVMVRSKCLHVFCFYATPVLKRRQTNHYIVIGSICSWFIARKPDPSSNNDSN